MTVRCRVASSAVVTAESEKETSREAGFTLLEILVVLTIIGLLIGLVAPAALRQLGGARVSVAKQSIERLSTVLDLYNLDMGSYPTTDQGLEALQQKPAGSVNWNGPYMKGDAVPLDPWSHPYVYRNPSERPGHDYDLCSNGPTGQGTQQSMICNP
jgi:general secretion pathway protein G